MNKRAIIQQPGAAGMQIAVAGMCAACRVPALSTHAEQIGQALKEEARFDGPTLFLKGAHSGYIEATDLWLMQHHFPMATLQQIERAGHWLHAENPEDFLAAVSAFLAA